MPIAVRCGKCGKTFSVPDNMAGKQAKCPCGGVLSIPAPAAARARQPQPQSSLASFLDEELTYERQKVEAKERQELEKQWATPQAAPMGIHASSTTKTPKKSDAYAACPNCHEVDGKRMYWTWWGGMIGPLFICHVKCGSCGTQYNGRSGKSNKTAIIIWLVSSLAVGLVGGVAAVVIALMLRG